MLNKLTIKARLVFLIGLMSLVGLAVGVVGLIQSSSGERAFDRIFTDRVLSIASYSLGGVAGAGAVATWLFMAHPSDERSVAAKLPVPIVGAGFVGAQWQHSF